MTTSPGAGWYDDRDDPNALRYWDGRGWTAHRRRKPPSGQPLTPMTPAPPQPSPFSSSPPQPPLVGQQYGYPPYPPPQAPIQRGANYKVIAFVAVPLLAAVVIVAIVAGLHKSSSTTASGGSASSPATPPSSLDQWWAAVCKPGSLQDGSGHLRNADLGQSSCLSNTTGMPITSGSYSSKFAADNDATFFAQYSGSSAIMQTTTGYVVFVAMADFKGKALQPLTQFGFTITSQHG